MSAQGPSGSDLPAPVEGKTKSRSPTSGVGPDHATADGPSLSHITAQNLCRGRGRQRLWRTTPILEANIEGCIITKSLPKEARRPVDLATANEKEVVRAVPACPQPEKWDGLLNKHWVRTVAHVLHVPARLTRQRVRGGPL